MSNKTGISSESPGTATVPVVSAVRLARQFRRRDANGSGLRNQNVSPNRARFDPVANGWGKKATGLTVLSREALEAAVSEIATLKLQHAAARTALELEIAAARERCQEQLLSLTRQIEFREARVSHYCQKHRDELFPGKKSLDLEAAIVGYRTGPPSVEKCSKKDTWRTIVRRLEEVDWGCFYLTTPDPEVDKKALLADRDRLTAAQLSAAGLRFRQDEVFFITPKSPAAAKSVREVASQINEK